MVSTTTARTTGLEVLHEVSGVIRPATLDLGSGHPLGVVGRGALIQILYIFPLGDLSMVDPSVELSLGITPTGNEIIGASGPIQLNNLAANYVAIADVAVNDLLNPQVCYASISNPNLWLPGQGAVACVLSYTPFVPG